MTLVTLHPGLLQGNESSMNAFLHSYPQDSGGERRLLRYFPLRAQPASQEQSHTTSGCNLRNQQSGDKRSIPPAHLRALLLRVSLPVSRSFPGAKGERSCCRDAMSLSKPTRALPGSFQTPFSPPGGWSPAKAGCPPRRQPGRAMGPGHYIVWAAGEDRAFAR